MGNIGRTGLVLLGIWLLLVAGCEDNPLYCNTAADCKDPQRPYCDLTGQYDSEHLGHSCVADPFGDPDASVRDPDAAVDVPDAAVGDPDASVGDVPTVPVLKRPLANAYVGSMHAAGSRKPAFEWRASTVDGGGSIRYDLQYSTDPTFDTSVTTVDAATLTSFQPSADLVGAVAVPVGARYYWRVRACRLSACSAYSAARLLDVGRSDNDFNGDGYADLAVSDHLTTAPGHVYVYLGPTLAATSLLTITGVQVNENFGWCLTVGDWNGDGYSDLAIGASGHDGDFAGGGQVRVYFGGTTFDTIADRIINGAAADEYLGSGIGNLGDVNGDGFDDLGVGATGSVNSDSTTGLSNIFFGGAAFDTVADATVTTPASSTSSLYFGWGVSGTDLNCDGYSDVVEYGATGVVFYGGGGTTFDTSPDVTLGPASITGFSVASAGDVNSDGCGDLIRGYTASGVWSARVTLGNATGSFGSVQLSPPASTSTSTVFGFATSGAGDVNNDGFADVVVGAHADGGGKAHVYFGGATMNATSDATFTSPDEGHLGYAVAGGSDVNGDGVADIAISAYLADTTTIPEDGRVFVLYGGTTFNTTADKTLNGFATTSYFGTALGL